MSDLDRQQQRSSSTSGDVPMGNGVLEISVSTPRGTIEMDGSYEQSGAEAAENRRRSGTGASTGTGWDSGKPLALNAPGVISVTAPSHMFDPYEGQTSTPRGGKNDPKLTSKQVWA